VDAYFLVKTLHVVSASILFGTGLGIAFFLLCGFRARDLRQRRFAACFTVKADVLFTLPAVVVQPVSGAWLVAERGFDPTDLWLVATYALYLLAGACWIPVVAIQMRMKAMLQGSEPDEAALARLFRWWFLLGWPAFGGLLVVFYMMVAKPSW
jgi:uncharacterized membrane protein